MRIDNEKADSKESACNIYHELKLSVNTLNKHVVALQSNP